MDTLIVQTNSVLRVHITSTNSSFINERRFEKSLTVAKLKEKLELITGCCAATMKLEVYSSDNQRLFSLDSSESLLGSYQIDDDMRIHVTDINPKTLNFADVTGVEKFELPDEEYEKRSDTVRSFLKRNKIGKYDPKQQELEKESLKRQMAEEDEARKHIVVGSRCEVTVPNQPPRRGKVEFVGYTDFKPDLWIGVAYDEPYGKHNGAVQGKTYFSCSPGYGSFVRHQYVKCGNFPELDDFEDDEM